MIVVDSSVWMDFFNGLSTPELERLDGLLFRSLAPLLYCPAYILVALSIRASSGFLLQKYRGAQIRMKHLSLTRARK